MMRVYTTILLLLNGIALFSLCLGCQPALAAPADYLHAVGTRLMDSSGSTVTLRGVNTGAWLTYEPFWYDGGSVLADDWDQNPTADSVQPFTPVVTKMLQGAASGHNVTAIKKAFYDNFFTEADVVAIKQFGFNSIRVPVDYRLFSTPASYTTTNASGHHVAVVDATAPGWAYLNNLMSWCNKAHVYVIIDMHIAPYGFADDPQALAGMQSIWSTIAKQHSTDPYLAGYDLLNEPNWSDGKFALGGASGNVNSGLNYVYQQLINSIRQVDQNHMIIAEGYMFADQLDSFFYNIATGQVSNTLQITDPVHNLALSAHHYNAGKPDDYDPSVDHGPDGTHYWWDETYQFTVAHAKKLAAMANTPLWIGEFGNDQNLHNHAGVEHFENSTDVTAAPNVPAQVNFGVSAGWALWTYKKSGFDVISIAPTTANMTKLNTDYWKPLHDAYANNTALPTKPAYMTPEWVYAALLEAAQKTNRSYCITAKDFADSIIRPTFNSQSIAYDPGATIPGRFSAMNYDLGTNYNGGNNPFTSVSGAAYNFPNSSNWRYAYRQDDVTLNVNADTADSTRPAYQVEGFYPGFWMRYTAFTTPGSYTLTIRYALASTPMTVHLQVAGVDVTGPITLPTTGSWTTFATASIPITVSSFGQNQIEFDCDSGGAGAGLNLSWFAFQVASNSIADGDYRLQNVNSQLFAEVAGASLTNGAAVDQWQRNDTRTNQVWHLTNKGYNDITLTNKYSGKLLEVRYSSLVAGLRSDRVPAIDQWSATGSTNQLWHVAPLSGGGYCLINKNSGMVLDDYAQGTSNGAALCQWPWTSGSNQQWRIAP